MAPKRDYYEVLGVPKDADEDALKKAFRRLARKYHPDRTDDPKGEEKFKEMKEAYDVLSDPKKRATYDQFGVSDFNSDGPGWNTNNTSEMTLEELLARMRAQGMDTSQWERRETVQKINVPVDIMINGGKTQFRYMNPQNTGMVMSFTHSIGEMQVKPGTKVGTRIKSPNAPDMVFVIVPQGHPRCVVQGLDLVVPMEVNALSAAIGNKASVVHPNGKTYEVNVPVGTKAGTGVRLSKLGLQHVNGAVGNLIAVVQYFVPKLDAETQEALRKLIEKA